MYVFYFMLSPFFLAFCYAGCCLIINLFSSGDKSPSCCCSFHDSNNDNCFLNVNSHCSAHTASNICPEGVFCIKYLNAQTSCLHYPLVGFSHVITANVNDSCELVNARSIRRFCVLLIMLYFQRTHPQ
jgi:hypothetical protein